MATLPTLSAGQGLRCPDAAVTYDSPSSAIYLAVLVGPWRIPPYLFNTPLSLYGSISHSRCPGGANGHPAGCDSLHGWFHLWYELVLVSFLQTPNSVAGYDTGQISDLLLMEDFLKRFATCSDPMDAATCKVHHLLFELKPGLILVVSCSLALIGKG